MKNETTAKLKVIYCMGSGRSGTTLMNILLGNHPDIFGAGEINNLHRLPEEKFKCSCGERVANCQFWSQVLETWKLDIGKEAFNELINNINKIENFKSPIAWLNALFKYPFRRKYLYDYLDNTYKFLCIIAKHSGKPVIVDISKNPLRALLLMQHPCIDLRLIHMVRDGRGVAWSLNKFTKVENDQRPVWRSALFWIVINRQSNIVRKKMKTSILIRYEDFVQFAEKTLNEIGNATNIKTQPIIDILNSEIPLQDSHIMAGNQLRKEKKIKLKIDSEWHTKMSARKKETFSIIARRSLKNYGYR